MNTTLLEAALDRMARVFHQDHVPLSGGAAGLAPWSTSRTALPDVSVHPRAGLDAEALYERPVETPHNEDDQQFDPESHVVGE